MSRHSRVDSGRITRRGVILASAMVGRAAAEPQRRVTPSSGAWLPKLSERIGNVYNPAELRWIRQLGARHVVWDGPQDLDRKGYSPQPSS